MNQTGSTGSDNDRIDTENLSIYTTNAYFIYFFINTTHHIKTVNIIHNPCVIYHFYINCQNWH